MWRQKERNFCWKVFGRRKMHINSLLPLRLYLYKELLLSWLQYSTQHFSSSCIIFLLSPGTAEYSGFRFMATYYKQLQRLPVEGLQNAHKRIQKCRSVHTRAHTHKDAQKVTTVLVTWFVTGEWKMRRTLQCNISNDHKKKTADIFLKFKCDMQILIFVCVRWSLRWHRHLL